MTTRTILYVIGPAWSGSSLLNALLNTQPGVAGLGEAHHFRHPDRGDAMCSRCRAPLRIDTCELCAAVEPGRLYGSVFDHYPDRHVLVDSSKAWHLTIDVEGSEEDRSMFEQRIVLLTKHPFQWAWSAVNHGEYDIPGAFRMWEFISSDSLRRTQSSGFPFLTVSYDALALDTAGTIARICDLAGIRFDADRLRHWHATETCIAGGNSAVFLQFLAEDRDRDRQVDQWYGSLRHQIRPDDRWRDSSHTAACMAEWNQHRPRLAALMRQLGHTTGFPDTGLGDDRSASGPL